MNMTILDDEFLARKSLSHAVLEAFPDSELFEYRLPEELLKNEDVIRKCSIAFLDIEMGNMNGIECAKKLKLIHPTINIIFTTGYSEYLQDAFQLHASGYLLKPITKEKVIEELSDLRHPEPSESGNSLRIQTFGNFEVFYQGTPLRFQYNKTRELLAYLVDRKGALCTNGELISILWEDEEEMRPHVSYLKNLKADLMNVLNQINCEDCIVQRRGSIGIVISKVDCDYFNWIAGVPGAINAYQGEYMNQYSWAETTYASLGNHYN